MTDAKWGTMAKFAAAKCACQGSESYTDPFVKPYAALANLS